MKKYPTREDITFYQPTKEERDVIASGIFKSQIKKIYYGKANKGKVKVYCSRCQRYETIDTKLLKQIRASHICPFCFQEIKSTSNKSQETFSDYVKIEDRFGYYATIKWRFGDTPKVHYLKQVMYILSLDRDKHVPSYNSYYAKYGFAAYIKEIGLTMMGSVIPCFDRPWTYTQNSNYNDNFYVFERLAVKEETKYQTKKEALTSALGGVEIKSNQKEIAIKNLLNKQQILLMRAFDLKSYEEISQYYKPFISSQKSDYRWDNADPFALMTNMKPLNKYFLEYLIANKVKLRDFLDYRNELELLGYKLDKPKDFKKAHEKSSKVVATMLKKNLDSLIKKRYKALPKYSEDDIIIEPFKTGKDIRDCAKNLHNCIATYIDKYATCKTELYHLDKDGELLVAIEINNGKLIQAKENFNNSCSKDLFKYINKFCKSNGIITRSENNLAY